MDSQRGKRRAGLQRMKNRARRLMQVWAGNRQRPASPRAVGITASTHGRQCSCFLCQPGPAVPPPRERAFDDPELP